ncbi:MAG: carbohydrate ABC transporter permease [Clostridia bacterium]|nr:carbohydrate ABC transporter permease [Clostridia bacterium]
MSKLIDKKSGSEIVAFIIVDIVIWTFVLSYVFSLLWGVVASMKTHNEIVLSPFSLPEKWHFKNFIDAFTLLEVKGTNMIGMIWNSLLLVIFGTFIAMAGNFLMAYALTKYDFMCKKLIIAVNLIVMTLPVIGNAGAAYRLYSVLGFIDSPTILFTFISGYGANVLLLQACLSGLPDEYMEAAAIDGAGNYRIMLQIMFPLASGTVAALSVRVAVAYWNNTNMALLYLPNKPTLATGIYLFQTEMIYRARMDILMAATILSAIPPIVLYIVANKTMLNNLTIGGLKG